MFRFARSSYTPIRSLSFSARYYAKLYTKEHEWLEVEANGTGVVGITDYAQNALGKIIFVELPEVGTPVEFEKRFADVESTKSCSEIKSPTFGVVSEVNQALEDKPSLINESPEADGWIAKLKDITKTPKLMTAEEYKAYTDSL